MKNTVDTKRWLTSCRTFHKVASSCSWKGSKLLRKLPVNITGSLYHCGYHSNKRFAWVCLYVRSSLHPIISDTLVTGLSLICIWRLNSPHTCTSLALFPFVSLSPVYDPDEKFWNYFKLAGTLTLTITFPAANAALWMPIKGTTDPWVDAIAGVTLLITNLANRWRHFQLALLIVMYQARRICNFFHARGKVSPILLV